MTYYIEGCPCDSCKLGQKAEEERKAALAEAAKIPTSRVLTRDMVLRNRPCSEYRHRFMDRFPVSVEVTKELAVGQAQDWDWWWAAEQLLSYGAYKQFGERVNVIDNEYDAATAPYYKLVNDARDVLYQRQDAATDANPQLSYPERVELREKIRRELMEAPIAARDAATPILAKRRVEKIATVWAELFLADEAAYNEQHQHDVPFVEGRDGQWAEDDDEEPEEDWYNDYEEDEDY